MTRKMTRPFGGPPIIRRGVSAIDIQCEVSINGKENQVGEEARRVPCPRKKRSKVEAHRMFEVNGRKKHVHER